MHNSKNMTEVRSFFAIDECPLTGSKSLHTTIELNQGQIICNFAHKEVLSHPNYLTHQIGVRFHIRSDSQFLHCINHSCEPNAFLDTKKRQLIALRKIEIGEELTYFYPSTEWSMLREFDCICQSNKCQGRIQGAAYLSLDVLSKYKLSEYIKHKLELRKPFTKAL